MHHPFSRIPPRHFRRIFLPLLSITLAAGAAILWALPGRQSNTLFDLALAGSVPRAEAILAHWTEYDRIHIAFVNGLDYLFGFVLFNTLALACVWATRVLRAKSLISFGLLLAWLSWLCVVLDIPENIAYLRMVFGTVGDPWPLVLTVCAVFRSAVFFVALAYVELAVLVWLYRRSAPWMRTVPPNKPLQPTRAAQANGQREQTRSGPRG